MEVDDLVEAIREQGDLLATAAEKAGADAAIPTCPAWCMRDLVRHQGEVHRWATAIVRDQLADPTVAPPAWPDDDELVTWFRSGCTALADVLEHAEPAMQCFAFLPAPSPLVFWARRQALETGVHRVDAQSAVGPITPFDIDLAVTGIEEMLFGFASRSRSRLRAPSPRALAVRATDAGAAWVVRIGPEAVDVSPGTDGGDCTVEGGASELFMFLWNRVPREQVVVTGDSSVLDLWQEKMQITWA